MGRWPRLHGPLLGGLRHAFGLFGRAGRRLIVVVVHEKLMHDVSQAFTRRPRRQVDVHDVGIDVHRLHTAVSEQPASELVRWTVAENLLAGAVALVTHAREAAVEIEAHDIVAAAALLGHGDGLTHGSGTILQGCQPRSSKSRVTSSTR